MIVNPVETKLSELRAFKTKSKIRAKEIRAERIKNLRNKFIVKVKLKNMEVKKEKSWKALAEVIVSG